jgi:hypothetical protein
MAERRRSLLVYEPDHKKQPVCMTGATPASISLGNTFGRLQVDAP